MRLSLFIFCLLSYELSFNLLIPFSRVIPLTFSHTSLPPHFISCLPPIQLPSPFLPPPPLLLLHNLTSLPLPGGEEMKEALIHALPYLVSLSPWPALSLSTLSFIPPYSQFSSPSDQCRNQDFISGSVLQDNILCTVQYSFAATVKSADILLASNPTLSIFYLLIVRR